MKEGSAEDAGPPPPHVVLLGDSTLDNVVWVSEASECISEQLRALLPEGARVTNYAADGFTTEDVLEGAEPCISGGARRACGQALPSAPGEPFEPLSWLAMLGEPAPTHVVLSVGGNDIREILGAMHQLQERMAAFHVNYPQIVRRIQESAPGARIILQLQYRPDNLPANAVRTYGVYEAMSLLPGPGTGVQKLNGLMSSVAFPPVLELARQNGLAVIDLPNTFDVENHELFECQIEPSAKGGALIAELIAHVVSLEKHPEASMLYSKAPGDDTITCQPNEAGWRVRL